METTTVGMIGLGRTGLPLAMNLLARGHRVLGFRRSGCPELVSAGGTPAASPREVAEGARLIVSCLPSAQALAETMEGEAGLRAGLGPEHVVLEVGSYPLEVKEAWRRRVSESGALLIDGEISGTPAMTAARQAVLLLAGEEAPCRALLPLALEMTDTAFHVGAFGAATRLKLVANHLVAVHTVAAAEALLLAERAGIAPQTALAVLQAGAGGSTMLSQRGGAMVARRFGEPAPGPVSMLAGYFDAIAALGRDAAVPTPLFDAALELYRRAVADGRSQEDIACVIALLEQQGKEGRQ
jgi:3-hydroxyisobutyrate dehydrogenase